MKLTLESVEREHIRGALAMLHERLPARTIVSYDPDPMAHAVTVLEEMLAGRRSAMDGHADQLRKAVQVVEEASERYS